MALQLDGTQTTTGTAAALNGGASFHCHRVVVQADPGNGTSNVAVGFSGSQSMILAPGDTEEFHAPAIADVIDVYVKAVSGSPKVNYHAFA